MMTVSIAIPVRRHLDNIGVIRERQFRHRTVDLFLHFLQEPRHGKLWLVAIGSVALAIPGDELHGHPPEYVISDRGGVADFRVLGETRGFEALVRKLSH